MRAVYPHLGLEERRKIGKWCKAKMPIPEICRHHSTYTQLLRFVASALAKFMPGTVLTIDGGDSVK